MLTETVLGAKQAVKTVPIEKSELIQIIIDIFCCISEVL